MNNIQRKGIVKMKIYKKVIACILTLMMFFAQMPANVFAANQKNNIPLDIVLVLDVSGSMETGISVFTKPCPNCMEVRPANILMSLHKGVCMKCLHCRLKECPIRI